MSKRKYNIGRGMVADIRKSDDPVEVDEIFNREPVTSTKIKNQIEMKQKLFIDQIKYAAKRTFSCIMHGSSNKLVKATLLGYYKVPAIDDEKCIIEYARIKANILITDTKPICEFIIDTIHEIEKFVADNDAYDNVDIGRVVEQYKEMKRLELIYKWLDGSIIADLMKHTHWSANIATTIFDKELLGRVWLPYNERVLTPIIGDVEITPKGIISINAVYSIRKKKLLEKIVKENFNEEYERFVNSAVYQKNDDNVHSQILESYKTSYAAFREENEEENKNGDVIDE